MKSILKTLTFLTLMSVFITCDPGGSTVSPDIGYLQLSITDAPIDASNVKSIWIKITEIEYLHQNEWHSTGLLSTPLEVDLLTLTHGTTEDFSAIPLSAGSYNNIRFILDIAEEGSGAGNSGCYIEFLNGSTSPLFVPSGEQSGYKAIGSFDITKDGVTGITVDFDLRKMVVKKGNGDYLFKPILRMVDNSNAGTITVPVDEGLGYNNIIVYAYVDGEYTALEAVDPADGETRFPNAVNSINADIDSNYVLPFLSSGTYDLVIVGYNNETFVEVIRIIEDIIVTALNHSQAPDSAGIRKEFTFDSYSTGMRYVPSMMYLTGTSDNGTSSIDAPYLIGETEVSYELWEIVYNWAIQNGYSFWHQGSYIAGGNIYHPVTSVTWRDSMLWCNAATEYYNQMNGSDLDLVYYSDSDYLNPIKVINDSVPVDQTPGSQDYPFIKSTALGFRLPSRSEWELAARYIGDKNSDGDITDDGEYYPGNYASGADSDYTNLLSTGLVAWYVENNEGSNHEVGSKQSNALGLYDMSGNVAEWCIDLHPTATTYRLINGGRWDSEGSALQVGIIQGSSPLLSHSYYGFRIVKNYE